MNITRRTVRMSSYETGGIRRQPTLIYLILRHLASTAQLDLDCARRSFGAGNVIGV
ncbi:hypothetical protein M378DRAFT_165650, partial [Amanita muscaria Koide BX008]